MSTTNPNRLLVNCWRCARIRPLSRISPAFGCNVCRPAQGTEEYERLRAAAPTGRGKKNRLHEEQVQRARTKAMEVADLASGPRTDDMPAALRLPAAQPYGSVRATKRPHSEDVAGQLDAAAAVAQREYAYMRAVDEALAAMPKAPRCVCCLSISGFITETEDGKRFCAQCAYATLRTGHCTLHNTTHYREIAAVTPMIPLWEYPRDVLGIDPETFRPKPGEIATDDG